MRKTSIPEIKMPLERYQFNCDFYGYQFALYIKESNRYVQLTSFDSCRENLIDNFIEFYEGSPYKPKLLDVRHTRLLVGNKESWLNRDSGNNIQEDILRGLKIVHHFEKIAKWPLCRIYRVIGECLGEHEKVYAFKASRRWQRSPYMLSLFVLLIRLGRMHEFDKFRTHLDFIRICKKLSKKKILNNADCSMSSSYYDLKYIKPTLYLKLRILMKHFPSIFGKRSARRHFLMARDEEGYYIGDGISEFCKGYGEDKRLIQQFEEICRKYSV